MARKRKLLLSLLVVGAIGSVASFGAYSAFTATTTNSGNTITAGTVQVGQHAGAIELYNSSGAGPGSGPAARCVRIQYTGSLAAAVKFYRTGAISNGDTFNLVVERGSGLTTLNNTMSCAGFTSAATVFNGTLDTFATTYAGGYDGKAGGAAWNQNDTVDYRFTITVVDDTTPNAHTSALTTGSHAFVWEARNN
jgi:hypothetical protein